MSNSRHDPEHYLVVRSLALRLPAGSRVDPHAHEWPQLIYGTRGVMAVDTPLGTWIVPPHRAVWMPPGTEHAIGVLSAVRLRTLYLHPRYAPPRGDGCRVLQVTPLLRELVREVLRGGWLDRRSRPQARLAGVLHDQLELAQEVPHDLPLPRDPRGRLLAERVRSDPGGREPLAALAADVGATGRTLERIFQRETGMSFGRWRRHCRLVHALRLLAEGASVTEAGLAAGYEGTSAFIAMFKRELGTTPGRYYASSDPGSVRTDA